MLQLGHNKAILVFVEHVYGVRTFTTLNSYTPPRTAYYKHREVTQLARVLVVDDEHSIRQTLRLFLEKAGYDADTADCADAALTLLHQQSYDAVFTDIVMPRVSGVVLLAQIRKLAPDMPVIMMTGEPTVETAVAALKEGAFDYVAKPVGRDTLLRGAAQAVRVSELVRQKQELQRMNLTYQTDLERMVRARTQELDQAMQGTIRIMISLVDSRDSYTSGHQLRVGNLCADIAGELGFSSGEITGLRITGYLHDIGKISIPSEILTKPTGLTHEELQLVRTHSERGAGILAEMHLPWPVAEMVRQHHERIDGSGYPRGLSGSEVRLPAMILAVADVVEAMSSHRPYRPSLGLEAALREIRSMRGTKFPVDVVDACLALFDRGYSIPAEYVVASLLDTE